MTYSIEKILEIMENYQIYKGNLEDTEKDYASVGVSIITDMPRANSISNVVEREALRDIEELPAFALMRTDKKYLDDRLDRIEDNLHINILALRMEGLKIREIAYDVGYSKTHIHRLLIKIAETIRGDRL